MNKALLKSESVEWATPQWLFDELNAEFQFDLDVCAGAWNHKCANYFDIQADGLSQEWSGTIWMNPPYGREIKKWMKKAYDTSLAGNTVVCLIPSRTDTFWWHEYAMKGEIRFIRGRICFESQQGSKWAAPFPSAIVIFRELAGAN